MQSDKYVRERRKRLIIALAGVLLLAFTALLIYKYSYAFGNDATVMIYMDAADLESTNEFAVQDISEMLDAKIGDNVNIVMQTGGTKKWHKYGISPQRTQRYTVQNNKLVLVDDTLPQLDMTNGDTLADFITWCNKNYAAKRNILIMWGHGGGSVVGFGYDEYVDKAATLTIDEMRTAINKAGVKLDFIGFDACLMSGVETAYALQNCADYMLASEDFVSGNGWQYTGWLEALSKNPKLPTHKLAELIADDFIKHSDEINSEAIMALVKLNKIDSVYRAWKTFAYTKKREELIPRKIKLPDNKKYPICTTMAEGGMADLLVAAQTDGGNEAQKLIKAASAAIVMRRTNDADAHLCGLSISMPYTNTKFADDMETVYKAVGFEDEYISWLMSFATHKVN